MSGKKEFEAVITANPKGSGSFITVPFDVEAFYGKKKVKIKALFDDKALYRGLLVRMGSPNHILIVRKDIQAEIGKKVGDVVKIVLEEDTAPRVVTVPKDYQKILDATPEIKAFFEKLSYTHKKEYVQWIEEAKKQETRERRMLKSIEMMMAGKKGV